jgi:uncharacterized membrane protein
MSFVKTDLFMIMLFCMGIALFVLFYMVQTNIPSTCPSLNLKNYLKGMLVLSTLSITIPISFLVCRKTCSDDFMGKHEITAVKYNKNIISIIYGIIILSIGIAIITLGVLIRNELIDTNCKESNFSFDPSNGFIICGSVYIILGVALLGYSYMNRK